MSPRLTLIGLFVFLYDRSRARIEAYASPPTTAVRTRSSLFTSNHLFSYRLEKPNSCLVVCEDILTVSAPSCSFFYWLQAESYSSIAELLFS